MKKQYRFSKNQRLVTKAEYQALFDKSQKITQHCLVVLFKQNQKDKGRLGVVVPKRSIKNASDRNLIKRIIRESFRINQEKLAGLDMIVIARQNCITFDKKKIREVADLLWKKLIKYRQELLSS